MKKAVVLLSGGLDSSTCLAIAKEQGYDCYAISFSYGQRHAQELVAAKRVGQVFGVKEHRVVELNINQFGGCALTDNSIQVPDYSGSKDIPITYVPARNTVFLSIALGYAEVLGAYDIFIGVNDVDYSGYPDCRPEFLQAFEHMANLATKAGVEGQAFRIQAPLLRMTKAEIIRKGVELGVDFGLTVSCYQVSAAGIACGRCDSCTFRAAGFLQANIPDPTPYQQQPLN